MVLLGEAVHLLEGSWIGTNVKETEIFFQTGKQKKINGGFFGLEALEANNDTISVTSSNQASPSVFDWSEVNKQKSGEIYKTKTNNS